MHVVAVAPIFLFLLLLSFFLFSRFLRCPLRRARRGLLPACFILFGLAATSSVWTEGAVEDVRLAARERVWSLPIPPVEEFPDAAAPNALRLACAPTSDVLAAFFRQQSLPFDRTLLRRAGDGVCHIWYEPTLRGYRADPDDYAIKELYADFNLMNFLALRDLPFGDSLDILKSVAETSDAPIQLTIGLAKGHPPTLYECALSFHFGDTNASVQVCDNGGEGANPWAQDYLKSGHVGADSRILVTRRLYEGDARYATAFQPLLGSFDDDRFVRSQLAWEGGDLQFVLHPRDSSRLVMLYGHSAWGYWGRDLSPAEYAYVLKVEFGADDLVDVGGLATHVDYFVSFIPQAGIALVSKPVQGNHELAAAAVDLLRRTFGDGRRLELLDLARALEFPARLFRERRQEVKAALWSARGHSEEWPHRVNLRLQGRILDYVSENCSEDPSECFSAQGQLRLLQEEPELLRDWLSAALEDQDRRRLAVSLLPTLESQLPGFKVQNSRKFERKVEEIKALGFRVIRVPRIPGDPEIDVPWAGVSYVNSLVIGHQVFVPTFGFGLVEERFLAELQAELPRPYQVVPIYARHLMLNNGGVHCAVGIVRSRPGDAPVADR